MGTLIETLTLHAPNPLIFATISLLALGLWKVLAVLCRRRVSALRLISGPASTHWFYGNGKVMMAAVRK